MTDAKPKTNFLTRLVELRRQNSLVSTLFAFAVILIFQIVVTLSQGASLTLSWMNILRNNAYSGIIALGMCFVIVSGGIDISVGSMLCALGAVLMYLIEPTSGPLAALGITGVPAYAIAIVCVLILGCVLGLLNGSLIAYGRIPAFIVTLGTMKIFRSVTQQLTKTFNPTVPEGFKLISSGRIGGEIILPILYWVVLAVIAEIIFTRTPFGKHVVAIGSNEKAAGLSGIHVKKKKLAIYAIAGLSCAVAAVIYISRIGSMDFANAGSGYEMDAIAAVAVGGASMSGGKGRVLGAFVGMLIIGLMNNILNTIGIPTFLCEAVKGLIIILAVLLQKKEKA